MTIFILYEKNEYGQEKVVGITSDEKLLMHWHKQDISTRSFEETQILNYKRMKELCD